MSGEPGDIDVDFDEIEDIPFAVDDFIVEYPDGEVRVEVDFDGRRRTVEPREVYRFEDDLVDELTENKTDNNRRGANIPVKGPWIHGWLENHGPDYIANTFRNYQYFLKYVQGRTEQINNVGTVNRSPGTYDSMYNYILLLEKLEVLERFKREEIPEGEFDHPVPDEFEDRTYLRVTTPLDEAPDKWTNPYKAKYPDLYDDDIDEEDKEDIDEDPLEPIPEDTEDETTQPDDDDSELEGIDDIDGFQNPSGFTNLVEEPFISAMEEVLDNQPSPRASEGIEPDDFSVGRVAVYGVWATGGAIPGDTGVQMLFELKNDSAPRAPPFIRLGLATLIENLHNNNNPLPEVFTSYEIDAVYTGGFLDDIEQRVTNTQGDDVYYELRSEELIEV